MSEARAATVLIVADRDYLPRLRTLAASIALHERALRFHFFLINCDPIEVGMLRGEFPDAEIECETRGFSSEDEKRAICANCRAQVLLRILEGGAERVLYLDADSIVRRPLQPLLAQLDRYDLLLHHRRHRPGEHEQFAAGVIALRNTEGTRRFVADWAGRVLPREAERYADQIGMLHAVEALESEVQIGALPAPWIDWTFRASSPVWAGKGDRKHHVRLYQLEEERVRRRFAGQSLGALPIQLAIAHCGESVRRMLTAARRALGRLGRAGRARQRRAARSS